MYACWIFVAANVCIYTFFEGETGQAYVLFFCNYPGRGGLDKSLDKYKPMILK